MTISDKNKWMKINSNVQYHQIIKNYKVKQIIITTNNKSLKKYYQEA